MNRHPHHQLSRRERQIMDIVWRRGQATAREVLDEMADAPGYSAVRAMLRLLEEKGHLQHAQEGRTYVYRPVVSSNKARAGALQNMLSTFFDNSAEQAVASLLELKRDELSADDFKRLRRLVEEARGKGGPRG
jgi:BlaI family penicillinase repressor